jgi:hypothetical protein
MRRFKFAILFLICFTICSEFSLAQKYPSWFLNQGEIPCELVAGYSTLSYYRDSSVSYAMQNAYFNYARWKGSFIYGGQAFWSTEAGTAWMGSNFREEFDTSLIERTAGILKPVDTLWMSDYVVVLMSPGDCSLPSQYRVKRSTVNQQPPAWLSTLPSDKNFHYERGFSEHYYYEINSWMAAETAARLNLAKSLNVSLRMLERQRAQLDSEKIGEENIKVQLFNVQVFGRWYDVKNRVHAVLVRMPK